MMQLLDTFRENVRVIAEAPFAFAAVVIAVVVATWSLLHFLYKNRISDLESKNGLLETDLQSAERRARPEGEVHSPLAEAVAEIRAGMPRRLTPGQRATLAEEMDGLELPDSSIQYEGTEECKAFAYDLGDALGAKGWRLGLMGIGIPILYEPSESGVIMYCANEARLTANERAVSQALQEAGVPIERRTGDDDRRRPMTLHIVPRSPKAGQEG